MYTINDFWKILQIIQGGSADDITEAVIALAKSEKTTAEKESIEGASLFPPFSLNDQRLDLFGNVLILHFLNVNKIN